mmetsp:Transcript_14370/g.54376  ORF Transcript_14370/g.54376 Transcript_14370/m.54376 type:complete len:310 (-) Transcript_14370:1014-1943(-)
MRLSATATGVVVANRVERRLLEPWNGSSRSPPAVDKKTDGLSPWRSLVCGAPAVPPDARPIAAANSGPFALGLRSRGGSRRGAPDARARRPWMPRRPGLSPDAGMMVWREVDPEPGCCEAPPAVPASEAEAELLCPLPVEQGDRSPGEAESPVRALPTPAEPSPRGPGRHMSGRASGAWARLADESSDRARPGRADGSPLGSSGLWRTSAVSWADARWGAKPELACPAAERRVCWEGADETVPRLKLAEPCARPRAAADARRDTGALVSLNGRVAAGRAIAEDPAGDAQSPSSRSGGRWPLNPVLTSPG